MGREKDVNSNSEASSEPVGDVSETDRPIPVQRVTSPISVVSGSVIEEVEDGVVILGYN